jgi:hypothetical protein
MRTRREKSGPGSSRARWSEVIGRMRFEPILRAHARMKVEQPPELWRPTRTNALRSASERDDRAASLGGASLGR